MRRGEQRNPFPAFMLMVCALAAFSVLRPYIQLGYGSGTPTTVIRTSASREFP